MFPLTFLCCLVLSCYVFLYVKQYDFRYDLQKGVSTSTQLLATS